MTSGEDRKTPAHSLFDEIIYNLDGKRIVDFKIKSWTEPFLVLRAGLYQDEMGEEMKTASTAVFQVEVHLVTPTGFDITSVPTLNLAIQFVLDILYANISVPEKPVTIKHLAKAHRNTEIRVRYATGESLEELAADYGVSAQRIHQIIHARQK